MTGTETYDVAIIGLGPVGGVLACLLGRRGHSVVVIERHASPYPLPRAVHFDHEVARILQACGLGPELGVITEPADVYEWRNGSGQVLLRFATQEAGGSGWPSSNMFSQPALEAVIERAVTTLPAVSVRRGWQLEGMEETAESVALTIRRTMVVHEADGGYCAECLTENIFTEGDTWLQLRENVLEATTAFFFDQPRPERVRLHLVRDEILSVA